MVNEGWGKTVNLIKIGFRIFGADVYHTPSAQLMVMTYQFRQRQFPQIGRL